MLIELDFFHDDGGIPGQLITRSVPNDIYFSHVFQDVECRVRLERSDDNPRIFTDYSGNLDTQYRSFYRKLGRSTEAPPVFAEQKKSMLSQQADSGLL